MSDMGRPTRPTQQRDPFGELAAFRQFSRLAMQAPLLLTARRGRGEPVVLMPGLGGVTSVRPAGYR
jgi:hypothetical protein